MTLNYNTPIPNFPIEQETQAHGVCYLQLIENKIIFRSPCSIYCIAIHSKFYLASDSIIYSLKMLRHGLSAYYLFGVDGNYCLQQKRNVFI